MYVETLYLKKHAMKISGYDQLGHHVWGYRIEDYTVGIRKIFK